MKKQQMDKIIEKWCKTFGLNSPKDKCLRCNKIHGLNNVVQKDLYKLIKLVENEN